MQQHLKEGQSQAHQGQQQTLTQSSTQVGYTQQAQGRVYKEQQANTCTRGHQQIHTQGKAHITEGTLVGTLESV